MILDNPILTFDDVLPDPCKYREEVLSLDYQSRQHGVLTFHGIAMDDNNRLPAWISGRFPGLISNLSFYRKSPHGQSEPNFIHADIGMGDWTAIFYLNEKPPAGDGTTFYKHLPTSTFCAVPEFNAFEDWKIDDRWEPWHKVNAKFNRLLLFKAPYFHSRSLYSNYGNGDTSRLVQVVFGTGAWE